MQMSPAKKNKKNNEIRADWLSLRLCVCVCVCVAVLMCEREKEIEKRCSVDDSAMENQ